MTRKTDDGDDGIVRSEGRGLSMTTPSLLSDPAVDPPLKMVEPTGADPLDWVLWRSFLPEGVDLQRPDNLLQLAVDIVQSPTFNLALDIVEAGRRVEAGGHGEARVTFDRLICNLRDKVRDGQARIRHAVELKAKPSQSPDHQELILTVLEGLTATVRKLEAKQTQLLTDHAELARAVYPLLPPK